MNKPTYSQVLIALCLRDPDLSKGCQSINHNELARRIQAHQPTVSRNINGQVASPSKIMGEKFCAYFGVSLDQLCGEAEIDGLFPDRNYTYTRPAPGVVKLDVARGNHGDMAEIARIREHLTDAAKIKAVMSLGEKLTAKDSAKLAQYFLARAVAGL